MAKFVDHPCNQSGSEKGSLCSRIAEVRCIPEDDTPSQLLRSVRRTKVEKSCEKSCENNCLHFVTPGHKNVAVHLRDRITTTDNEFEIVVISELKQRLLVLASTNQVHWGCFQS